MVINCVHCGKLYFLDSEDRQDKSCPVCGAEDAEYVAMTIFFAQASSDALPVIGKGQETPRPHS